MFSRRKVSRLNLIVTGAGLHGLVMLAIDPDLFDPVFRVFNFQAGDRRRLIGVLMLAVIVIFGLLLRTSYTDGPGHHVHPHLVEALACSPSTGRAGPRLPPGERVVVVMPASTRPRTWEP